MPVLESENNINKSLQSLWTGMKNWSESAELKTRVKQPAHINHWPGLRHPLAAHKHCSLSVTSHKAPSQFLAFPLNRLHRFAQIFSFSFCFAFVFVFLAVCTSTANCAVNDFLCLSYSMLWTISVVLSCLGKHGVTGITILLSLRIHSSQSVLHR